MRRLALAFLALAPAAAWAQAPAEPAPGGTVTRQQFIDRAAAMAARRFDMIDTGHTGVVTREQVRAFRQAHGAPGAIQ